jgi:1,2-diacylglycerol 3-alpha-glucosyltransferase
MSSTLLDKQLPKIAVIWSRVGPYHMARLRGAAEQAKNAAHVIAIEIAETDDEYLWEVVGGDDTFVRHTVFPGQSYHSLTARAVCSGVIAALDEIRPNVVAINGWSVPEARAALGWASRHKVRAILMSETKEDDAKRSWWKEMVKRYLVRKFDAAIVGGLKQKSYLMKLGMPEEHIRIGYDVVDNQHFEAGAEKARADQEGFRRRLGLPNRYFFACTRFLPRKNVDNLLGAYASYRASVQDPWELIIAGTGPEFSRLRRIEAGLEVEGVRWLGFVQYQELPLYSGLASAFVHPAKSEPWGLVLNEAAASRLPLIVSDRVGARYELLKEGENGFLFDPYDLSSISRCLLRIAECSSVSRAKMGYHSSVIVNEWGPDRFGRELLAAAGLSGAEQIMLR